MIITSPTSKYTVGELVAGSEKYRLYLCRQEDTNRQCLLQIASDAAYNGALDRAAYILRELKRQSDEVEEEYARVKKDSKVFMSYDLAFPELVDTFVLTEQGGRRVNILAFRCVDDVTRMVPLYNIIHKDKRRVDLRTSAWIMGKILKILGFAHSVGIAVNCTESINILIEPKEHCIIIFDWTDARMYSENVPDKVRSNDIAHAARAVIDLLGGDYDTCFFHSADGDFHRYTDFLLELASGNEKDANRAHTCFYELVDELWKRKYHPFTSFPQ